METGMSSTPAPAGKKRGCLFYGLIIAGVVVVLAGIGSFMVFRWVTGLIEQYTATEPLELPVVDMPEPALEELQRRWDTFKSEVEGDATVQPLELTADEINALIQNHPKWKELKGHLFVEIEEQDRVRGQVSIPLGDFKDDQAEGRYLNGSATFDVSMDSGILVVTLTSVTVKGEPLPDAVMQEFAGHNLASDLYDNADTAKLLRRLDKVEVKDGKVRITPRAGE